jgi:hypothetical protein
VTLFRLRWPRRDERDLGSTLIVAMMVMMLAASLCAVVVKVAIDTNAESGVDRQRTVSINAAEAGLDATFATIEGSGTSLPCVWPTDGSTYNVYANPDPTNVTVAITYYDASGNAFPASDCSGGVLNPSDIPASALIESKAVLPALANAPRTATRYMQSSVNLTPIRGKGLTNAIFGDQTIFTSNKVTVYRGSGGDDGNLYTNGDFTCDNNESFQGSMLAPKGSVTLGSSCSFTGDVWVANSVNSENGYSGTIGGRIIASTGNISLTGGNVGGTLQAAGTINYAGCSVPNKCFENQGTAAPTSPSQPFPHILGDATTLNDTWGGEGWNVIADNDCTNIVDHITNQSTGYATLTGKTLVTTPCSVAFNKVNVKFKGDFALFASGGITSSQQVTFDGSSPNTNVYMIVPWTGTDPVTGQTYTDYFGNQVSCPAGNISFGNNFSTTSKVNLLVYTPCDLSYANNNAGTNPSQIYAGGTVTINNQYTMTYYAVPLPTGAIAKDSLPTLSYSVAILYKRETAS